MYIVAPFRTLNECTQMYVNVRLHTTVYNILRHDVQPCTTMFDNVRQKWLPYDTFCRTQTFYMEILFKNSQHYLRKPKTQCEQPRQPTTTHEKLQFFNSHLVAPCRTLKVVRGRPALALPWYKSGKGRVRICHWLRLGRWFPRVLLSSILITNGYLQY